MKRKLNESGGYFMIFIKCGFVFVLSVLLYEVCFGIHIPKLHGNLKGRVPYKHVKKPVPRTSMPPVGIGDQRGNQKQKYDDSSQEGTVGVRATRPVGSVSQPLVHRLMLNTGDISRSKTIEIASTEPHQSMIVFDSAGKESRSHSLMQFARLSVAGTVSDSDGIKHKFHEVKVTVSDLNPSISEDSGVASDCNVYISTTNEFPTSYENVDLGGEQSVAALWEWKSNAPGPDSLTLHTYSSELTTRRVHAGADWGGADLLVNHLYLGLEKRFGSHDHLAKATGTGNGAGAGDTALQCTLEVCVTPVKKEELSKKLGMGPDGRVIMPRDIADR